MVLIALLFGASLSYQQIFTDKKPIVSPLPNFLTAFANDQVSTLNLWSPFFEMFEDSNEIPIVTAKSALVYDLTSKKVLFSKEPLKKLPMASLTKIMTAVVAIESAKKEDE